MTIAQRIMIARKLRGFSQTQMAEKLQVSRGSCSQWERGKTSPSVENLSKLALLLNVHFEWLATGRGERDYIESNQIGEEKAPQYAASNQINTLFQLLPNDLQIGMLELLKIQSQLLSKNTK
ncbi:MAG: helix-turn-helix domain-containing protein [gamma proteobacterium symbiont of Taylorina sp.]|nr:helix-turn-helix domain-containing protein [gamma proteobacterium symbiont of Taylorina sp.]